MKNADQIDFWNAKPGEKWTRNQVRMDQLFVNLSRKLLDVAQPTQGMSVLEVGCGTGALALDLAERVSTGGSVTGVDVSEPMLGLARERVASSGHSNIELLCVDAQTHNFQAQQYDLIVSRFGVMFFEDPVAAFANLRLSTKPGARTVFAAWSSIEDNPWFRIPRDVAIRRLGKPSPQSKTAPGPTAFADLDYVSELMTNAGYTTIESSVEPITLVVQGNEDDAAALGCDLGPVSRIAMEKSASSDDLAAIHQEVAKELKAFVSGDCVNVPASINFVSCSCD